MTTPTEAIHAFLAAFDRKREISKGVHVGVEIVAFHARGCRGGFCKCGGSSQKRDVMDALEALRGAVRS